MKHWMLYASLLLLVSCCMAANPQSSEKLSFEVASIKPSEPMTMGQVRIGMNSDAGMLRYTNVSLKDCIRAAYRVKEFQIEGPGWIESARFDITAKLPEGSNQDQVPEMLQALLADRFKLTFHRDSKDHAIYALVVGKNGPKLKPADVQMTAASAPPAGVPAARGGGMPRGAMMIQMDQAGAHLKAPAATLTNIADMISRFTERPVVDMTEIKGQYDFDLVFAPEVMRGMRGGMGMGAAPPAGADRQPAEPGEKAATIAEAVQAYGLKLEPRKAPMDVLIIDSIEKTPTEN